MIQLPRLPSWRFAAAVLLLASGATTAHAQDVQAGPSGAPAAKAVSAFELSGRMDLEQATQYILQRIAEHKQRLGRMQTTEDFFRRSGDVDKVRLVEELRERELNALQQTLEEYHRLLGSKDFDRVIAAVRERLSKGQLPEDRAAGAGEGALGNPVSESRRLAVERARASQRAKIAARMKDASSKELRRRAQAARSLPNARPSAFGQRGGANRGVGSGLPGAGAISGAGRMGQPFNPYTRQRGRP